MFKYYIIVYCYFIVSHRDGTQLPTLTNHTTHQPNSSLKTTGPQQSNIQHDNDRRHCDDDIGKGSGY